MSPAEEPNPPQPSASVGTNGDSLTEMLADWEAEFEAELTLPEAEIDHRFTGTRMHDIERLKAYLKANALTTAAAGGGEVGNG